MRPFLAFAAVAIALPVGADTSRPQSVADYARFAELSSTHLGGFGSPWYMTGDARFACLRSGAEIVLAVPATGLEHGRLTNPGGSSIHDGGFSADGRFVVTALDDNSVRVYDVATCKEVRSFTPFGGYS